MPTCTTNLNDNWMQEIVFKGSLVTLAPRNKDESRICHMDRYSWMKRIFQDNFL